MDQQQLRYSVAAFGEAIVEGDLEKASSLAIGSFGSMHRGLVQSDLWGEVTSYRVTNYRFEEDQAVVMLDFASPTKRHTLMTHWTDEGDGPQIVAIGPRPPGVPKPKPRPPKPPPPKPKKQAQ